MARFETARLAVRNNDIRTIRIGIDVIAEMQFVAMLPRAEEAEQARLLHQQPDVVPVGHPVLHAECETWIGAPQLERKLVGAEFVPPQDRLDDLRHGLLLINARRLGQTQARDERFDDDAIRHKIARLAYLSECSDTAGEGADGAGADSRRLDCEGRGAIEIVGAHERIRARQRQFDSVGLAELLVEHERHDRQILCARRARHLQEIRLTTGDPLRERTVYSSFLSHAFPSATVFFLGS